MDTSMRSHCFRRLGWALWLGLATLSAGFGTMALGQSNATPPIANRPSVVPPAALDRPGQPKRPERPEVPGQPPSQGVKDLVQDYQATRQSFLKQQQELSRQLKNATAQERNAIRQQMREKLQQWMDQQKAQRQELIDQAKDMKNNNLRDVINSGGGDGRGR